MASCGYNWDAPTEDLGTYLACILGNAWSILTIVLVGITVIIIALLIVKTIQNRENSKELPNIIKQWQYVLILAVVTIGGIGSFINIILAFLGLPTIDKWLEILNDFLATL